MFWFLENQVLHVGVVEQDKLQRDLATKKRSDRKKAEKEMKKKQTLMMENLQGMPIQFESRLASAHIELSENGCTARYIAMFV